MSLDQQVGRGKNEKIYQYPVAFLDVVTVKMAPRSPLVQDMKKALARL